MGRYVMPRAVPVAGQLHRLGTTLRHHLPTDLMDIARDEARHFLWLQDAMKQAGCQYGDLTAHSALWQDAHNTRHDLAGRLAVVPLVQEAKAMDAAPRHVERLRSVGQPGAARVVQQICDEELGHVFKGVRWFAWLAQEQGHADVVAQFHDRVTAYIASPLRGPFNDTARAVAQMTPEWYLPLASPPFHQPRQLCS